MLFTRLAKGYKYKCKVVTQEANEIYFTSSNDVNEKAGTWVNGSTTQVLTYGSGYLSTCRLQ